MPTPTKYTYSIASDFPATVLDSATFAQEIQASSIATALDRIDTVGDVCDVWFRDALSAADKTTLDNDTTGPSGGLIAAHTGKAPPKVQETRQVLLGTGLKLTCFGYQFTATKTTETTYDFALTQSVRLRGAKLCTGDAVIKDTITIEVVDVDNILGYGAGTVLATYTDKWNVNPAGCEEIVEPTIGDLILSGLYLRTKYNSVGTVNDVAVCLNYISYKEA